MPVGSIFAQHEEAWLFWMVGLNPAVKMLSVVVRLGIPVHKDPDIQIVLRIFFPAPLVDGVYCFDLCCMGKLLTANREPDFQVFVSSFVRKGISGFSVGVPTYVFCG